MKKGIKARIFIGLRDLGLLCKKEKPYKPRLKLQKSISPDGETIDHSDFTFAKNALSISHNVGRSKQQCQYNFSTHTCRCGITLDKLKNKQKCSYEK